MPRKAGTSGSAGAVGKGPALAGTSLAAYPTARRVRTGGRWKRVCPNRYLASDLPVRWRPDCRNGLRMLRGRLVPSLLRRKLTEVPGLCEDAPGMGDAQLAAYLDVQSQQPILDVGKKNPPLSSASA